jgi:hypothetical protein
VNDLPAAVRALGEATPGASVAVESVAVGGAGLADQWMTTGARDRIASGHFDAVVLQGQSVEPITTELEFEYYAGLLAGVVRDSGARTVWFATWARRAGDPFYDSFLVHDPVTMTNWLESEYQRVAFANGGFVARVGAAWLRASAEQPNVDLYADDGSHPSAAGTLLTACAMLQAITGKTPRLPDPAPLGVDADTAQALCALAPKIACIQSQTLCDKTCVDLATDAANCGTCGMACSDADPCLNGVCGCPAGTTACARSCVDLMTRPDNCGACGVSCGIGGSCENGSCRCSGAETVSVPYSTLSGLQAGCVSAPDRSISACNAAAHQYCAARGGCSTSGFGPALSLPDPASVACVSGDVQTTTFATLQTWAPGCDGTSERIGASCSTAISRYCASTGAVSGFGPVSSNGDQVTLTCLRRASIVRTTYQELAMYDPSCDGTTERWGAACSGAIWMECSAGLGHLAGFGPVDASGDDVDIVCVDE